MDTTLITSTAAVLALGGFAIAEWRARRWRRFTLQAIGLAESFRDIVHVRNTELYAAQKLSWTAADIDAGIARQRELRLKRSQAQTRRQA